MRVCKEKKNILKTKLIINVEILMLVMVPRYGLENNLRSLFKKCIIASMVNSSQP
jgi:hypothetical protein